MIKRYSRTLNVMPFVIVPNAVTNQEAILLFASQKISSYSGDLIQKLYEPISKEDIGCPVILQLFSYKSAILLGVTIQTSVRDIESGRLGQKLSYGALINFKTFSRFPHVCHRIHEIFDIFFLQEFGCDIYLKGDEILRQILQRQKSGETISSESLNSLLNLFESEFNSFSSDSDSLWSHAGQFLKQFQLSRISFRQPLTRLDDADSYWKSVDLKISQKDRNQNYSLSQDAVSSYEPLSMTLYNFTVVSGWSTVTICLLFLTVQCLYFFRGENSLVNFDNIFQFQKLISVVNILGFIFIICQLSERLLFLRFIEESLFDSFSRDKQNGKNNFKIGIRLVKTILWLTLIVVFLVILIKLSIILRW